MGMGAGDAPSAPRSVALVGFMAAGKSAVGRAAAGRLGAPFVDTDALIELRAGSIPALFEAAGEDGFRRLESDVVLPVLREALHEQCVVALGGGAVLSGDVRQALRRLPHVVWLTAPLAVLWARASATGASERPLAQDRAAFARLLAERSRLYAEVATAEIANDGSRSVDAVIDDVVRLAGAETSRARAVSRAADARR